jgi:hypothetical protein
MSVDFIVASHNGAAYSLGAFTGVPAMASGLIAVHAGSSASSVNAARLAAELETVLLASGPTASCTRSSEAAYDPTLLAAFAESIRQKLLVLVIDDPLHDESWFAEWLQPKSDRAVLTVFKSGADPSALLPSDALKAVNAQFWKDSVTEAVPAILSLSGLTLEDQRIFISYRRLETQPLAEQLFDALTHEGLDVFLDRFSIHPGINFQQRLTQELADKSMVLLLESAQIEQSLWTDHEIQFTKRYQLGLLALTMPDRTEPLKSIDVDQRIELKKEHFRKQTPDTVDNPEYKTKGTLPPTYAQWGLLTDEKLREVVLAVKSVHDQALFRRRRFIRTNVEASLQHVGLLPSAVGTDGLMRVNAPGVSYALWLTARPPEMVDFYTTHGRLQPPAGTRGVVVGPTAALEPGRIDKLVWLKTLCKMACIDQDDMPGAAILMKAGKL